MVDQVAVRLAVVGGSQFKGELQDAGVTVYLAFARVGQAGRGASAALDGVSRSTRNVGYAAQNAAFQVGDFFVQIASGTSASRALAQQAPQLLGVFGIWGAIAGAGIAALSALIPLLSSTEAGVEKTVVRVTDLAAAIAELRTKAEGLKLGVDEVEIEATKRLRQAVFDVAVAQDALNQGIKDPAVLAAFSAKLAAAIATRDAASRELETYRGIRDHVAELTAEKERQEAMQRNLNEMAGAFARDVHLAFLAARQIASLDLSGPFAAATGAAQRLFGVAQAIAGVLPNLRPVTNLQARAAYDATGARTGLAGPDGIRAEQFGGGRFTPPVIGAGLAGINVSRGGGGGSGGAANPLLDEAKRIYDQTRTSAEKYATEQAKLNDLLAKGAIDQDTYNRAMGDLRDQFDETRKAAQEVGSAFQGAFRSLFEGIVDGSVKIDDILTNLAKKLAVARLESAAFGFLSQALPGVFGPTGWAPLVPSAKGNVINAGEVMAFARGGIVNSPHMFPMRGGRTGLMGEAGPEGILPLTRIGGKLGVHAGGMGGGGTSVEVHNYSGQKARTERSQGPDGREVVKVIVGEELSSGGFDRSMRGRYAATPAAVRR